jgi:oligo-alginate lyase
MSAIFKLSLFVLFVLSGICRAQHPRAFVTATELASVKAGLSKYPLLQSSYAEIKHQIDPLLGTTVDVPFPKDPAGGYTHDRHKSNYMILFHSGLLYQLTGDIRYATLAKQMFLQYADLNPRLPKHPQATSSSPGRLFWQALNDANWLVYAGMAFDLIQPVLTVAERNQIIQGALTPEVDYLTKDLQSWFDLIHNHGVWACAGVGISGIAADRKDWVDMALYGTSGKGTSGFLAQMQQLIAPDGYYTEGPYYVRYAILPYFLFANALQHDRPALQIFQYRSSILKKALYAGLQQTNLNGMFFSLNDALKNKDYTTNELVTAVDIAYARYGADTGLAFIGSRQQRVLLHPGGLALAADLARMKKLPTQYPYQTVEYRDGKEGTGGGVSFIRNGADKSLTTLIFKYSSHGLSHGHYDRLNINLFDRGNEILPDYGSARFIGIEQKYGGRYLPENKSYATQTIAHSTVVVDEKSHFNGIEDQAEAAHPQKLFSMVSKSSMQVVSAQEKAASPGVDMRRTVFMVRGSNYPQLLIDLFEVSAQTKHQYDFPIQYNGQFIQTNFPYQAATKAQTVMGAAFGYQHLWKEASATARQGQSSFTFLQDKRFYTIHQQTDSTDQIFFTRSGAGDPNFNLRRETSMITRRNAQQTLFFQIVEMHGDFDPVAEFSKDAYGKVSEMRTLQQNASYTVVSFNYGGQVWVVAKVNQTQQVSQQHRIEINNQFWQWQGAAAIWVDGKPIQ